MVVIRFDFILKIEKNIYIFKTINEFKNIIKKIFYAVLIQNSHYK